MASRSPCGSRSSPTRRPGRCGSGPERGALPRRGARACLTAHPHAPDFSWQENFQVGGDIVRDGDGWALAPHRLIGGFEPPDESELARYRRNLKKSIRFYRTRRRFLAKREQL